MEIVTRSYCIVKRSYFVASLNTDFSMQIAVRTYLILTSQELNNKAW